MKVEIAGREDLSGLRQLWKRGFGESEAFLDFYFTPRFDFEHTFLIREGQEIVASAMAQPYTMHFFGESFKASYILGVVTHPQWRRRGLAAALMKEISVYLEKQGIFISALIPAEPYLLDVYRKYGFTELFAVQEEVIRRIELNQREAYVEYKYLEYNEDRLPSDAEFEKFHAFYTKAYKKLDVTLIKSLNDLKFCIEEFLRFEGRLIIAADSGGRPLACAFLCDKCGQVFVKELLYTEKAAKEPLLAYLMDRQKTEQMLVKGPPDSDEHIRCVGMIRMTGAPELRHRVLACQVRAYMNLMLND